MQSEAQIEANTGPAPPAASPDWAAVLDDIPCPRCGYNLRELPQPRCPECGLEFVWWEVLAAVREQTSSPLFEYQWRRRPVRSFFGTTLRLLAPGRFWRDVPIALPVRVSGLLLHLGLLCLFAAALALMTRRGVALGGDWLGYRAQGFRPFANQWACISALLASHPFAPTPGEFFQETLMPLIIFGGTTWAAILLFWQTRRNYRIRQAVVLRATVYSLATMILIWCLAFAVIGELREYTEWRWRLFGWWNRARPAYLSSGIALLFFYTSLGFAWRRYICVDRGWGLVLLVLLAQGMTIVVAVTASAGLWHTFQNPVAEAVKRLIPPFWPDYDWPYKPW